MIHIIQDNFKNTPRYFAVNTCTLAGDLFWRNTPEDAFNFFTSGDKVSGNHSVAESLAKHENLESYQRIYKSYSPKEYPELFI